MILDRLKHMNDHDAFETSASMPCYEGSRFHVCMILASSSLIVLAAAVAHDHAFQNTSMPETASIPIPT